MLRILSFICLGIAIGTIDVACKQLIKPVDGPGMERDTTDLVTNDSTPSPTDAKIWYMDGAAYVATYNPDTKEIKMKGGTMDEARSFTLRLQNPDDPFYYDVVGTSQSWLSAAQAFPDVEDGKGYYIFTNKTGDAQSIMYQIPSIAVLEDVVKGELASIVEGEYKDALGRKAHITEWSLQLPGEKGYSMMFGKKGSMPINVMVSNGKCWRFTGTYDGLTLRPVRFNGGSYVPVEGGKTIHLVRQNGTMGRFPQTSMMPMQHTMLQYLDSKALRYMRNEIYVRLGGTIAHEFKAYFKQQPWYTADPDRTHLTKLELHNFEVIKAEESRR